MRSTDTLSGSKKMKFANAGDLFDGLGATQFARILADVADIILIVNPDDVIIDASIAIEAVRKAGGKQWVGRTFPDIVTSECVTKVQELLGDARAGRDGRTREINHPRPRSDDIALRYKAVPFDDKGNVIAFGQDMTMVSALQQSLMNSQLSIEREYSRLRAAESRYRMIFQLGDVPQIVVDATTLRVCDINPAALKLLGRDHQRVENVKVVSLFDGSNADLLHQLLRAAVDDDSGDDIKTELRGGEMITIAASHFRQESKNYLLLRLSSDSGNVVAFANAADRKILDIVERMPDAFAIVNSARQIIAVNDAFVDLLNLSGPGEAEGQTIDRWFERPGVDFNVLMANIREHGSVRRFSTVLRTSFDQIENVEIAAVQISHHDEPVYGFAIRSMSAALAASEAEGKTLSRSDEQITSLVGHMPLKDIVRETTEMIETLCIETALELTKNNRALAAQMLGLSRQSLYAKLGKNKPDDE